MNTLIKILGWATAIWVGSLAIATICILLGLKPSYWVNVSIGFVYGLVLATYVEPRFFAWVDKKFPKKELSNLPPHLMNTSQAPRVNDVVRFLHKGVEKTGQVVGIGPEFAAIDTENSNEDAIIPVGDILHVSDTTAPWEVSRYIHAKPSLWQRIKNIFR